MASITSQQPVVPVPYPPPLEVLCVGCGVILEVDPGLTEFVCPDCHTAQSLPPELMPRKRKALPLTRSVNSSKIQLPCGSCGVILSMPYGLSRFDCPECGVALAVDHEKLKAYLSGASFEAMPLTASGVRLPPVVDVEPQIQFPSYVEINRRIPPPITAVPSSTEANASTPPAITPVPPCVQTNTSRPPTVTVEQDSLPAPSIPPFVNVEQRSKRAKKQPVVLTKSAPSPDDVEPTLRRSSRLAKLPDKCNSRNKALKKKKKEQKPVTYSSDKSQPGQSEYNGSQLETQDNAMHDNELFSTDFGQPLTDATHLHSDTHINLSSGLHLHADLRSESPVHPGSGLHVHPSPSQDQPLTDSTPVHYAHEDQSPDDCTVAIVQVDALIDDEGDETYVAEQYSSHSEPELTSLETPGARNRVSATPEAHRRARGPTRPIDLRSLSDNNPVEIKFNHLGQPVGKEAAMLTRLLSTISHDGTLAPVNFIDWRAVPKNCKITMWCLVKSKFKVEEVNKKYIMRALGRHWTGWKYTLKQLHYDTHDNDGDRLADIDRRIVAEQWPFLVHFWSSEEGQKRSAIGKASRSALKAQHTSGTKSFAQICEEERLKRPSKEEPSRAEIFIMTHTRKDGTPIDEEAAIIIARLREELNNAQVPNNKNTQNDIFAKVLCEMNKPSSLRHYGLLPVDPPKARKLDRAKPTGKEKANIIAEARRLADEETKPLREKMEDMEKRHEEMVEEMNRMRSTMKAVHQLVLAQDNPRTVLLGFFGGHAGED
ncbi:Plant transposase (Ptta/En/Spm family) [Carex littledalei]|uniref:Plant transposase (Ptta/En/Spm family) n=1 Tax=Carex littledalei TaxID=544730 RepID=A0A833R1E0_9POAL|nr:Plant transposase (Ptta/En/Spm family) [Carex littledalei]